MTEGSRRKGRKATRRRSRRALLAVAATIGALCQASIAGVAGGALIDVAITSGVTLPHQAVEDYFSVGQAWGDYDGDGWLDLYVTDHAGPNALYLNQRDGTFVVSPHSSLVSLPGVPSAGAAFADFDNDGDQDLYVANRGANSLFRNDGPEVGFTDVTAVAGVGDPGKGSSAAWGDFDGDGRLDLYVANWLHDDCWADDDWACPENQDRLYRSLPDGSFEDLTASLGLEKTRGLGFAASFVDFDNDGDLDLYLVNDAFRNPIGNQLWRNDGPPSGCADAHWCWTDVSASAGADVVLCGMGLATCDYDRDGDLDFFFSNAAVCGNGVDQIHHLLQNQTSQGSPAFLDVSVEAGVASDDTGWGTVCFDYDNDGWPDLYLTQSGPAGEAQNHLYRNNADGTFTDVAAGSDAADPTPTWGVAYADYDRDGWVDLITTNRDAGVDGHRLLRNTPDSLDNAGHWLAVELHGSGSINRDAVGTRVEVEAGPAVQFQEVKNGSSLGAGSSRTLHFGLGPTAAVDRLHVRWPDGSETILESVEVDRYLEIRHPGLFSDGFESGDLSSWGAASGP